MRGRPAARAAALLACALLGACGQYSGITRTHDVQPAVPVVFEDGLSVGPRLTFDARTPGGAEGKHVGAGAAGADPTRQLDGPLFVCPVQGRGFYTSSFGAYRAGPPVHPHQGNDMFAPAGTPIVAPFEGWAVPVPNDLGGRAVRVYGPEGYVYNAHLSRYGHLGPVDLGEVVGYVGSTGNAAASSPHDHFEWHPANGAAVDPFPFLNEACPRTS